MIYPGRRLKNQKSGVQEDTQAVCVVLDTFRDKRAVPRWSQCCAIFSISDGCIKGWTSHALIFYIKEENVPKSGSKRDKVAEFACIKANGQIMQRVKCKTISKQEL